MPHGAHPPRTRRAPAGRPQPLPPPASSPHVSHAPPPRPLPVIPPPQGVYTPQPWRPELADASLFPPDADLELRHVYSGARGPVYAVVRCLWACCSLRLFPPPPAPASAPVLRCGPPGPTQGDESEFVFYSAAAGALVSRETGRQRFFLAHTNDVASVAVCPAPVRMPDGTVFPARTLVATGARPEAPEPDAATACRSLSSLCRRLCLKLAPPKTIKTRDVGIAR